MKKWVVIIFICIVFFFLNSLTMSCTAITVTYIPFKLWKYDEY